jgi:hypothetical protein
MIGPGGRLLGELGPQQPPQSPRPPSGVGGSMIPPGQEGADALPKPRGEGDMNSGDLRTHGALVNNARSMNAPRPPTAASAAVPTRAPPTQALSMPDLRFGMSEMFANGGRAFDFPDLL